jgi:UDP-N-acetyl-2-amino-2-deoxyglucuronate dehydrogenase
LKNFALIGAGGYIAPKHMRAIKDTGNTLVAALDKHDSVGILDSYFPEADFFTEFERFDRHLEKIKRNGNPVDYLVVCSPNYLHDAHIRFGLRLGADVICEKPVVLNPWNVDALLAMEKESNRRVYTMLQLRLHPAITAIREKLSRDKSGKQYKVELRYITARGNWYQNSWKGDVNKSGGITSNIGVHFFDLLLWLFGDVKKSVVHQHDNVTASGDLLLEKAEVKWFVSIDKKQLTDTEGRSYRFLKIDNEEIDLGTTEDLHTAFYKKILSGDSFPLSEAKKLTELLHQLRA